MRLRRIFAVFWQKPLALFSLVFLLHLEKTDAMKYPNEIAELPIVSCEQDRIMIKTSLSNPSHIYAENFHDNANCVARNLNRISIPHGQCGMIAERMNGPTGMMQRVCVAVQLHPLFVTEADRSYCAQCVYVENGLVNELQRTLGISDARPSELTPRFEDALSVKPKCSYTIRRSTVDGPEIHYATIGESVFHVWECNSAAVGILVQNCFVEDGQGNKILIIDKNGCGVDQYVLATPTYAPALNMAYQSHVFKFAEKTITRFSCQIRLCVKSNNGCKEMTPPHNCPNSAKPPGANPDNQLWPAEAAGYSGSAEVPAARVAAAAPALPVNRALHPPRTAASRLIRNGAPSSPASAIYRGNKSGGRSMPANVSDSNELHLIRQRRQHILDGDDEEMALMYPATNVVGVIQVLDSPDDANYFEDKYLHISKVDQQKCLSSATYFTLIIITMLFAVSQAIFMAYRLSNRCGTK